MKTPEAIAQEIVRMVLDMEADWVIGDEITAAIAAERAKADALVGALRAVMDTRVSNWRRFPAMLLADEKARAALAAYESDAPKEAGG